MRITIGIDPDSKAHGVAIYHNETLVDLFNWELLELREYLGITLERTDSSMVGIHIENVCANNAAFAKSFVKNQRAASAVSRSLGLCQQSQLEVERLAKWFNVKLVHHPISSLWKDSKQGCEILKKLGWLGRSNEDTRSAAYFGYLGVKSWRGKNQ